MLYHLSIDADNPKHVARVLAEILGGQSFPFPPVATGSWVAMAGDERNTFVEVYPRGTELRESEGDADAIGVPGAASSHSATHFAIATEMDREAVFALAARENWPAKYRRRGGMFGVIEVWIEGTRMIEVLTQEMGREYLAMATMEVWERSLEKSVAAADVAGGANEN